MFLMKLSFRGDVDTFEECLELLLKDSKVDLASKVDKVAGGAKSVDDAPVLSSTVSASFIARFPKPNLYHDQIATLITNHRYATLLQEYLQRKMWNSY